MAFYQQTKIDWNDVRLKVAMIASANTQDAIRARLVYEQICALIPELKEAADKMELQSLRLFVIDKGLMDEFNPAAKMLHQLQSEQVSMQANANLLDRKKEKKYPEMRSVADSIADLGE